jgi:hypothetical protein
MSITNALLVLPELLPRFFSSYRAFSKKTIALRILLSSQMSVGIA